MNHNRITVLAHGLTIGGGQSVGTNVIEALGRVFPDKKYLLIVPDQEEYHSLRYPPHSKIFFFRRTSAVSRIAFDLLTLPRLVSEFASDLILGLGNIGLVRPPCAQALLIHKPQLVYPRKHRPHESPSRGLANRLLKHQLARALPKTQVVFCQTEVMRERFLKTFRYQGLVSLMPNAVSEKIDCEVSTECPPELGDSGPFRLFVLTRYYAHKNLELIVECFDRYRSDLEGVLCILTLSERDHPRANRFLGEIQRKGLGNNLINIGPIPQRRLASFYSHCNGLLLPTLLESFSGTYLEAFKFDRPILTSDLDFARGICGNAALYFDPWDPASLRAAILTARDEPARIAEVVRAGKNQLSCFSAGWDEIVSKAGGTVGMGAGVATETP